MRVWLASICVWIRFCTWSGWRTSVKRWRPSWPADSISRSPAPMMRSKMRWWKLTLLTRSSGISMPFLANTPWRKITRSEVITKCVVRQVR